MKPPQPHTAATMDDGGGGVDADQVEDRRLQHVALDEAAEGAVVVPAQGDLRPPNVLLHQPGQVSGVHVMREVIFIDLKMKEFASGFFNV